MGSTSRCVMALAVALAGEAALAQEAGAGIAPRFAWPEKLEGRRVERKQGRAEGEVATRVLLRLERRGGETWLVARPDPLDEKGSEEAEGEREPAPPMVLGADGRFVRLDGLDALVEQEAAFQVGIAASKAEAELARKEARERVGRLSAEAREQWSYQGEAWLGRTLALGQAQETTGRVPVAAVPGLEVEQRVVLAARKWVSCAPGGLDRRCLELTLKADAGSEAFRKALLASGAKAAKGFEDGSLAVDVVLVTDPETLLPWRYTFTRKLKLVFAGRDLSVDQVERRDVEYQWWKG